MLYLEYHRGRDREKKFEKRRKQNKKKKKKTFV